MNITVIGMKYFITEAERKELHSTCLFEFQKGIYHDRYWCEDSICLHAEIFDELKLFELFHKVLPHFDYYGRTEVSPENWEVLLSLSHNYGGEIEVVISEIVPWIENCFQVEKAFTICGI